MANTMKDQLDGGTTITFKSLTNFTWTYDGQSIRSRSKPARTGGIESTSKVTFWGKYSEKMSFQFMFVDNGSTAFVQTEAFFSFCKKYNTTNKWTRQLIFDKPDGIGTKTLYGVVENLVISQEGGDVASNKGSFDFAIDTVRSFS